MATLVRTVPRSEPLLNLGECAELFLLGDVAVIADGDSKNPIEEVTEFVLRLELPDSGTDEKNEGTIDPSPPLFF